MPTNTVFSLNSPPGPLIGEEGILDSKLDAIADKLQTALSHLELNAEQLAGQIFEIEKLFEASALDPALGLSEQSSRLDTMIADVISELRGIRRLCR